MNSFFDRAKNVLVVLLMLIAVWSVTTAKGQSQEAPTNGQSVSAGTQVPSSGQLITANGAYRLGPADIVKVTVLKQALLTQDGVRIDNDGNIRLPMLTEPVHAACLTEAELATVITQQYRKYILDPQVFVSIVQFNSNSISVIGAVTSPGRFQLQGPVRLLQVLALVNGPAPAASDELQILRTSPSDYCGESKEGQIPRTFADASELEILVLKMKDIMSGSADANPVLRGGDIIRVPTADLKQAFVQGNVRTATAVNLKDPVSLTNAIAMAGGPVAGAQLDKIKITRQTGESLKTSDILVNFKEIRAGTRADLTLEPNDIVTIPGPSGTKKLLTNILRGLVPMATGYPMMIP